MRRHLHVGTHAADDLAPAQARDDIGVGAGRLDDLDMAIGLHDARCVAVGDSFLWISAENTCLDAGYGRVQPIPIALESLRALRLACRDLNDTDVEAIFYRNAAALYELD